MDVTAPRTSEDLTVRPLRGTVVRALGDSLALRVAAARLRALGCAVETTDAAPPPDAPAGWLGVVRASFLPGAHDSGDRALPECGIGWSGPVGVPMSGERDVQAACGIMHVHGRATGGPRALRVDFASVCAGVLAAQAVAAGMLAVLRGGTPVRAATSVAQAAALALTQYVAAATSDAGAGRCPPGTAERTPPFRSADGVGFEIETFAAENWLAFWTALGAGRPEIVAGWPPFQQRFATATCTLPPGLRAAAAALGYPAVRAAAHAAGVSIVKVDEDATRPMPPPPSPWRLRATTTAAPRDSRTWVPPSASGQHTPLAGVRVVESTNRVQGPLAGHLLHLLGAGVVRLEPPGGDPMRGVPPLAGDCSARFLALNRGKSAVEADLKTRAGREAALRHLASSDVFLQNWPPGRASRFELDAGDLAAVRPGLVYAHAGGWAETHPAPQPMGTDYLVQAYTGVAAMLAEDGQAPAPTLMTIIDVLGALIGAEGTVAGLLARARTGTGVRVETGLADAARLLRDAHVAHPAGETAPAAPVAPVVTDLAAMAADPAYEALFETGGGAAYSRSPWTFAPQPPHRREDA
ncbi:CoA transferase [Actinomadura sp. 7K507]|uniref:CoA transferase n=1 Tax=Actinomadura sp. 7K507 TaxID=2530365 RepID=UPI0010513440|nr:CoA transferase [Actinomadura sp. 7K507]TDC85559.1 CoA transferase [Actinomadura sp. 7K507]